MKDNKVQVLISKQEGQALIFVTLAFVVLGLFIGLAVDGGRAYLMRERLRKIVDAAALAGAKAMAAVAAGSDAEAAAKNAACESAMINGLNRSDCFTEKLSIQIEDVTNPDGTIQKGVVATGTDSGTTFFMSLGALLGCSVCKEINVAATGKAVPDTLADIVLVLDDTGTMSDGCNAVQDNDTCPIRSAKRGANTFMNLIFDADRNGHTKIGYVPFRGCYKDDRNVPVLLEQNYRNQGFSDTEIARWGCIQWDEIQELTTDRTAIAQKIETRRGSKGFPGTNLCLAMVEGRKRLFEGRESRAIARKIMVILSDGSQNYSDSADGPQPTATPPIPNWGDPIPTPYPNQKYDPLNRGDQGRNSTPSCMPTQTPGHETLRWGRDGANFNLAMAQQDTNASNLAASLKNTDRVEIYFLRFTGSEQGDALTTGDPAGSCDPSLIGNLGSPQIERSGTNGTYNRHSASNDIRDRNLARCLASNTAMGDPFARAPNDHYFFAPTAGAIQTQLEAIAKDILNKRRLVG